MDRTKDSTNERVGHTPGPWVLFAKRATNTLAVGTAEHTDAVVHWAGFDGSSWDWDVRLANARLIEAAPELLEACERVAGAERNIIRLLDKGFPGWRQSYLFEEMFADVRAAIEKAIGEEVGS